MDKGNNGSRYKGFRPHSLRMQTSNRHTTSFNRPTTPRINEYLPALPVELNLRGGNLESAVRLMHGRIGRLVGGTIGNNHPVISGALKLSASVIMMAGLAGMISGCAAGGNINSSQDENRYENTHEHGHEHGSENGLEHRGQHTGINGVSSLDECLLDEYLGGWSQSSADSRRGLPKSYTNYEKAGHKKELCAYLHKHFNLENADEILKSLPEDNYLETLELIKYAHDNLGFKDTTYYNLRNLAKLAKHNGLDLLKYAHTNCGLKKIDYFNQNTLVDLAMDRNLVIHLKTNGKELFDYVHTHLGLDEIPSYSLKDFAKLAGQNALDLLKYVHDNLELMEIEEYQLYPLVEYGQHKSISDLFLLIKYTHENLELKKMRGHDLKTFTELAKHNGLDLLKYAHENLELKKMRGHDLKTFTELAKHNGLDLLKYAHENFGLKSLSKLRLSGLVHGLVQLAEYGGLDLLKYAHEDLGLTDINDYGLFSLIKWVKSVSLKELKRLKEQYGIDKVNSLSDLIKLSENIDSLDKKKVYLHKQYGITHFERYSSETIEQLYNESTDFRKDERDVILYVMNKNDRNNSFKKRSKEIKFLQKSYRVVIYEEDDDKKAIKAVEKTSKRIGRPFGKNDFVIFGGHGSKVALNLGYSLSRSLMTTRELIEPKYEHLYLDVTDEKELKELEKYVSEGSTIILDSCSTGEGGKDADNLANTMASCLPSVTIYAAKSPTMGLEIQKDNSGRIKNISFPFAETYKVIK